jgi:hypothetical protein
VGNVPVSFVLHFETIKTWPEHRGMLILLLLELRADLLIQHASNVHHVIGQNSISFGTNCIDVIIFWLIAKCSILKREYKQNHTTVTIPRAKTDIKKRIMGIDISGDHMPLAWNTTMACY